MKLSSIMTGGIESIAPQATLAEAAKKMASQDIGSLPVCADRRTVVGIITDRDITVRAVARGMDPNHTRVEEVMTRDVLSCSSEAEVEEACQLMEKRQVRRLLVTDGDETPVGIVSLGDIALCLRESQAGEVLKKVSEPDEVNHGPL
jgi:CBS domain-containing protein